MKSWWILNSHIDGQNPAKLREKQSTIVAAQDKAISTNYFKNEVLKEEIENKCGYVNNMKKLWNT
jgi:hypothetical protein